MEQFIGFQIDGICYLDSYKFLSSSLDVLVKNLHNDGVQRFKYMQCTFGAGDPNIFEKGIYPYENMTGRDVFKQTSFPSMDAFYLKLKMEGITADKYKRVKEIWSTYKCKNMQDFHNAYVKLDVVLLADCMENFC